MSDDDRGVVFVPDPVWSLVRWAASVQKPLPQAFWKDLDDCLRAPNPGFEELRARWGVPGFPAAALAGVRAPSDDDTVTGLTNGDVFVTQTVEDSAEGEMSYGRYVSPGGGKHGVRWMYTRRQAERLFPQTPEHLASRPACWAYIEEIHKRAEAAGAVLLFSSDAGDVQEVDDEDVAMFEAVDTRNEVPLDAGAHTYIVGHIVDGRIVYNESRLHEKARRCLADLVSGFPESLRDRVVATPNHVLVTARVSEAFGRCDMCRRADRQLTHRIVLGPECVQLLAGSCCGKKAAAALNVSLRLRDSYLDPSEINHAVSVAEEALAK